MAAHTSTAANAHAITPRTAVRGEPQTTNRPATKAHRTSPITPISRPLVGRKRWTSSDTWTTSSRRTRGEGQDGPSCEYRARDWQLYAGVMTSTATTTG